MDAAFRQECALLGLDPDRLIPPKQQTHAPTHVELYPWFANAWSVFARCATQWQWLTPAMGAPLCVGLNYAGVHTQMECIKPKKREPVWWAIRVMEAEVLAIRNAGR